MATANRIFSINSSSKFEEAAILYKKIHSKIHHFIMRLKENILLRKFSSKDENRFILHFKLKNILCIDCEMNSEPMLEKLG